MRLQRFGLPVTTLALLLGPACAERPSSTPVPLEGLEMVIELPQPRFDSSVSLEQTLLNRRSIREYADTPLSLEEVSQLLWAAQGITSGWGGRTAPSAGALYPLELYLVVGNVSGLTPGVYRYVPSRHHLIRTREEDLRAPMAKAALSQECVDKGAIDIVIAAVYERTTSKYDERGVRYVHMEAGHAAQNLYLQATSMGLSMVTVGAFDDERVSDLLGLPKNESPLYIVPVGRKKS